MSSAYADFQRALAERNYTRALTIFGDVVAFTTASSIQAEIAAQEGDEEEAAQQHYLATVGERVVNKLLEDLADALNHPRLRPSRNPNK